MRNIENIKQLTPHKTISQLPTPQYQSINYFDVSFMLVITF